MRPPAEVPSLFFDSDPPKLLEGRDYEMRPDGTFVFSKEHLLARGTCCGSKCLNCPYEFKRTPMSAGPRAVISMVPSWTETLIACGANVQGRTRFCIHPHDLIKGISVFGGTKTLADDATQKIEEILKASSGGPKPIVVLDREENPKSFFEFFSKFDVEIAVTHVENGESFERDLSLLASAFSDEPTSAEILKLKNRWRAAREKKEARPFSRPLSATTAVSGESEILDLILNSNCAVLYVIWRNPWMVVRHDTWIGEMLRTKFSKAKFPIDETRLFSGNGSTKYPEIIASDVPPGALVLFSSEPYPFKVEDLKTSDLALNSKGIALVNGEAFSWFGLRALRFLEDSP